MVCMLLGPHNKDLKLQIEINSLILPIIQSTKFLGTWIHSGLNWKTHVDKLLLRITSRNSLLK